MKPKDELEFYRVRFEYCKDIYHRLTERKDKIENKAKLLLSVMGIFLSAIILNIEKLDTLRTFLSQGNIFIIQRFVPIVLFLTIGFFLFSIIGVFNCIRNRTYHNIYPENFASKFLFSDSEYFINEELKVTSLNDDTALSNFYFTMTSVIILSTENNAIIVNNKAKWFHYAWISLLITLFLTCISLILCFIP